MPDPKTTKETTETFTIQSGDFKVASTPTPEQELQDLEVLYWMEVSP